MDGRISTQVHRIHVAVHTVLSTGGGVVSYINCTDWAGEPLHHHHTLYIHVYEWAMCTRYAAAAVVDGNQLQSEQQQRAGCDHSGVQVQNIVSGSRSE